MANLNIKTSLTGGAVDCVDRNTAGMKVEGSVCFALIDGSPNTLRSYKFSASSTATANGDTVIIPYGQSGGTAGRWLLKGKMRADNDISGNAATATTATTVTNGVYTNGDQTVAGIKTFSSSPVVPDATTATQAMAYGQVATANAAAVKTALNAAGSAPIYACRAWVVFNGTGTVSIYGSANVSSVTDRGTGQYRVNFTTSMANVNFSGLITPGGTNGVNGSRGFENGVERTTSYWEILTTHYSNGSSTDCSWVNVIIYN